MSLTTHKNLNDRIISQALLSQYTTFRLGGKCSGLVTCPSPEDLAATIRQFHEQDLRFIVIGGGSNLLVSDKGIDCYVIRYVSDQPHIIRNGNLVTVTGSTTLDHVVTYCLKHGLEGLNFASGIPGTVGGAIVGNAGAFGRQVGDVVQSVLLLTPEGLKNEVPASSLGFSYRNSNLKTTGDIVLSVTFSLHPSDKVTLQKERDEILKLRHEKHPDLKTQPSAGSFFRNIEPTSQAGKRQAAGWFLEQAGAKQLKVGGARVFDRHANIIIAQDGACSNDVFELSKHMAHLVKDKFHLELVREVRLVGRFDHLSDSNHTVIW